jgi:D-glycero-D-manno-heptose 1,7-bisphosphate phosphatase
MSIKTIFLDRDGVINKDTGYIHKIQDFEFIDGVFEACQYFQSIDYKIIIITNQSGIGRGYYSENDFEKINNWMLNEFEQKGISILDVFHCPHLPSSKCNCRKPKPGMILKAQSKYNIDMNNSWLIGDKEDDIIAANNAGIYKTILVKSENKTNEIKSNTKYILDSIKDSTKIIFI